MSRVLMLVFTILIVVGIALAQTPTPTYHYYPPPPTPEASCTEIEEVYLIDLMEDVIAHFSLPYRPSPQRPYPQYALDTTKPLFKHLRAYRRACKALLK